MKVDILTLFPQFFEGLSSYSILGRALQTGILELRVHDIRDFTQDRHQQADDYRFGGGPGMLLKPDPIFRAFSAVVSGTKPRPLVIYPSPQGKIFSQEVADDLAGESHLVFLCGHYKGIDQRIIERWVDREYSLGDFVLTGGEIAALAMIDATVRMIPGAIGDIDSALGDSFRENMLDCAHYTRPENIEGLTVPGVLLSGHHKNIDIWRDATANFLTRRRRPDLIEKKSQD